MSAGDVGWRPERREEAYGGIGVHGGGTGHGALWEGETAAGGGVGGNAWPGKCRAARKGEAGEEGGGGGGNAKGKTQGEEEKCSPKAKLGEGHLTIGRYGHEGPW
ncbi:hypothetical protein NL676_007335 [Syzygium grande]|nr:hypothetical protein NL676_007335 [Syzygium grande]